MDLNQILLEALSQEASDVHIKEGASDTNHLILILYIKQVIINQL